jgi:peptidoglycan/xylan/chitin deacetylase (PgdA/CDA1 family)
VASIITEAVVGAASLGLVAGGLMYASAWPTSQLFGKALVAGSDARDVALTFDDGPNDAATPELLEVLARHRIRATFFMIGNFARQRPAIVREVARAGHLIGNHTMSHPRLSIQPAARVRYELAESKAVLEGITGTTVQFFRPPFGARRPVVLKIARELGLTPVLWNVTGYDWNPIGADGILRKLDAGIARNRKRGVGSNLLLHDGSHRGMSWQRMDTVRAVDRLLTAMLRREESDPKIRFVRVDAWTEQSVRTAQAV